MRTVGGGRPTATTGALSGVAPREPQRKGGPKSTKTASLASRARVLTEASALSVESTTDSSPSTPIVSPERRARAPSSDAAVPSDDRDAAVAASTAKHPSSARPSRRKYTTTDRGIPYVAPTQSFERSAVDLETAAENADAAHVPSSTGMPLPRGKKYHFFICHHQASGGPQCGNLCKLLQKLGYSVWYDKDRSSDEVNVHGMQDGVHYSMCLLIFLSGRKERDGNPDPTGQYEGPFTRWYCHDEMRTAREAGLEIVGMQETDDGRRAKADIGLEKAGAARSKHTDWEQNVKLLDTVNFIPYRDNSWELPGMLL
eukprot:COSAG06_NODE_8697_length_2094_cov_3.330827_1_plen_313_part_01